MVNHPADWTEKTINDMTYDVITGGTPSTANALYWDGSIPWIASAEINKKIISKPTRYITEIGLSQSAAKVVPGNTVLVALAGQGKTRGTVAYLSKEMAINQSLAALVPSENTDVWFLYYLLEANYRYLREKSSGDGGRGGLNKKLIKGLTFVVPSRIQEQALIGNTLKSIDDYIGRLLKLIEKKKGIRDGAIEELVSGKLKLDGQVCSWTETELGKVADYRKDKTVTERRQYVSTENMNQMFAGIVPYDSKEIVDGTAFSEGDTLIGNIRPYLKKVWRAEFSGSCSSDVLVLAASEKIVSEILYYYIANNRFINYVMTGGIKGIKMPRGDKKYILHYPILIPSEINKQKAIAEILFSMDKEIKDLEIEREKIIQIREGVMNDLLTGKVRLGA